MADRPLTKKSTTKAPTKPTHKAKSIINKTEIARLAAPPKRQQAPQPSVAGSTIKRSPKKRVTATVSKEELAHPIATAIDRCIARISDVSYSVKHVMAYAAKSRIDELDKVKENLLHYLELLKDDTISEATHALTIKQTQELVSQFRRYEQSELIQTLATGNFLTLFSSFDAFTGELLTAVYKKKPDLYNRLNRTMTVAEMLQYSKVDDIKDIVLKSEIEAFRRKSYVEQFEMLENLFYVQLTKFKHWPEFVECAQRRNLFTHCDGYVSDQYISICKDNGFDFTEDIKEGTQLNLKRPYLTRACAIVIEVALKLGQTLWRKVFPEEIEEADRHLQVAQFEFLGWEEWGYACMAGEFAMNLPKYSTTVLKTIMAVNYAIALFRCKEEKQAMAVLDAIDWTALCFDFRLAERVLRHDYNSAKALMIKIGKKGEFFDEHSYLSWPLFWDFRQSAEFSEGYRTVFGYSFTDKLQTSATETQKKVMGEIQQETKDGALLSESVDINCEGKSNSDPDKSNVRGNLCL